MTHPPRYKWRRFNLRAGLWLHGILTAGVISLVVLMTYRSMGEVRPSSRETNERAAAVLANLKDRIENHGAADLMQSYFPEGACFLYTLYGLAWANLAADDRYTSAAQTEILMALDGQTSPAALDPFRYDTAVRRGMFWMGQRNLLLARYITLYGDANTTLTQEFRENSAQLHAAIMESPTHHVESYDGMCWPADHPMGLLSLKVHDDHYGTTYSEAGRAWIDYHKRHGWAGTQLPVGRLDVKTGQAIEPARGCANSLTVAILHEMDADYAAALYADYREHFAIARCGFAMFREYPAGENYTADVDSGPIIMDAGVTATGIGLAAARAVGDRHMENDIRDLSEMFGFPFAARTPGSTAHSARGYLWDLLPIGDAFLAWGYSTPRTVYHHTRFPYPPVASRLVFAGIVALTLAGLAGQWYLLHKTSRRRLRKLETPPQEKF